MKLWVAGKHDYLCFVEVVVLGAGGEFAELFKNGEGFQRPSKQAVV